MTDDELFTTIEQLYNSLRNVHSFQGKKVLLTLSIVPGSTLDGVNSTILLFQAGVPTRRDSDQGKLISEMVRHGKNRLLGIEDELKKGSIIFTGPKKGKGGQKELIFIVSPFIQGYEDYVKGHLDTRFILDPMYKWLMDFENHRARDQTKEYTALLGKVRRLISSQSDKVTYGIGHVLHDIRDGRADEVIASNSLARLASCPKCGVTLLLNSTFCAICESSITSSISQMDEVSTLCLEYGISLKNFDEEIAHILDEQYFSIICIRRY